MSVDFKTNRAHPAHRYAPPSACLCAQRAPGWGPSTRQDALRTMQLEEYADPRCGFCSGTGIEPGHLLRTDIVNLSNLSARACLAQMLLPDRLYGRLPVLAFLRAVEFALQTAPSPPLAGARRKNLVVLGTSEAAHTSRLRRLREMAMAGAADEATHVEWD